jgi:hypothetical protein
MPIGEVGSSRKHDLVQSLAGPDADARAVTHHQRGPADPY